MFNTVLTALGGFFSRAFWLGTFAPVASMAVMHLLIASVVFPDVVKVADWINEKPVDQITGALIAMVGVILLAYAVSPLTPLFRGYLDGTRLPAFVRRPLQRARHQVAYRARRHTDELVERLADVLALTSTAAAALEASAAAGVSMPPPTAAQNDSMEAQVARLQVVFYTGEAPAAEDSRTVCEALAALLSTQTTQGGDPESRRLNRIWADFVELLQRMAKTVQGEFEFHMRRSQLQWRLPDSGATAVGDTRRMAENYSLTVYGANFEYIWPRLQILLDSSEDEDKALEAVQTQIEFSVLALILSMTVPLVWLPAIGIYGVSLPLLLAVAAFGPVAWVFFYQLVVQSQSAFGGVVQALLDRRHLDLLEAMSLPRPTTTAEERALWEALQAADQGAGLSLRYAPPKAATV